MRCRTGNGGAQKVELTSYSDEDTVIINANEKTVTPMDESRFIIEPHNLTFLNDRDKALRNNSGISIVEPDCQKQMDHEIGLGIYQTSTPMKSHSKIKVPPKTKQK
jgi:hypothetical protein